LTRDDFRAALPGWITARVLVAAALGVAQVAHTRGHASGAHIGLLVWDGDWYRRIAEHGYARSLLPAGPLHYEVLRFFPLYPLLARGLGFVLGGHVDWALVGSANGLALVLGALVHRLCVQETGDRGLAVRAAWLTALLPPGFVLVMGYSEPLALCLAVGMFLLLRGRSWWWAAALGMLAGLARPVGLLLVVPAAIEAARGLRSAGPREQLARLAAVVSPMVGAAIFLAWVGARFGSVTLPLRVQQIPGLRGRTVNPIVVVVRAAAHVGRGQLGRDLHWATAVVLVGLVALCWLRWPAAYAAFATASVAVALAAQYLGSLERYGYDAFPLVLTVAGLTASERVDRTVVALSAGCFVALGSLAFLGLYVP
jgi:hypothetical protein